jgi:RNA polymerase sigma factor (sigma-70 family)
MEQMSSAISSNRIRPIPLLKHVSDDNLVAQAKLGCEQAFAELWSRHGERARHVVWRITRNREDADDVLQEAYLKSFLHLVSFNGHSRFSTWLSRIAINVALMLLRKRRNHPEVFIDNSESDPSAPAMDFPDRSENIESRYFRLERMQQLRMAIQKLPPPLRYVVELQNRDELPLEEIAHRTGISVAAVKSRLVRARATLRELTAQPHHRSYLRGLPRRPREMNQPLPLIS